MRERDLRLGIPPRDAHRIHCTLPAFLARVFPPAPRAAAGGGGGPRAPAGFREPPLAGGPPGWLGHGGWPAGPGWR
jgi:hypothetical protein